MSKAITDHAASASRIGAAVSTDNQKAKACNYYLGIDGGGTKTHAIITDDNYRVLGEGFSGASNPLRAGLDRAVAHIEAATQEACAQAGIKLHQITAGCVGLAGISHQIHYHTMKDALEHTLRIENLQLTTDAQAALEGALDGQPGIVLIAGTGSIALGKNSSGEQARSGGWGPTFGDEGSGYDIARRALKAVVSSFDGRSPKTMLTELVTKTLRISSTSDLPGVIYNSDMESVEIASLAKLVAEAAAQGDVVAQGILAEAGEELAHLAVSVIERLGIQSDRFRVACVGSVFKSGDHVLRPLREAVQRVAPEAEVGPPLFSPTIGAVKLAQKRCRMSDARC